MSHTRQKTEENMKRYSILCVVVYFLSECYGKCSDHYVVLQRTDLNNYIPADMNHIDIFSYPYNNSEEFKELHANKDCIITNYVKVNECHTTETICKNNSTIKHGKEEITLETNYATPVNLTENNKINITEDKTHNMTETIELNNEKVNNKFKEKAAYTETSTKNDKTLTEINETRTDESSKINDDKTGMIAKNKGDNSKMTAVCIVATSVPVVLGVLLFAIKKLLYCSQQGAYHLPEPNSSI